MGLTLAIVLQDVKGCYTVQPKIFANFTKIFSCVNNYIDGDLYCIDEDKFCKVLLQYKGSWAWQIVSLVKCLAIWYNNNIRLSSCGNACTW